MIGRKARLIVAAAACIAVLGGAWWGYDRLRGHFMHIDEAESALYAGDYRSAFQAAERLAPDGDIIAQTMLGWLYWKGRGVDQNYRLAAEWLSRAAEQGHARAMTHLADLHFNDYRSLHDGRVLNRPLAAELYRQAAEAGDSYAQRRLGQVLVRGLGVDRDVATGVAWMTRAINAGERWSVKRLGGIYHSGQLPEPDPHKALDWYGRGVTLGDQDSAWQVIELLRDEQSPVYNLEEAYIWALVASRWWSDDAFSGEYYVLMAATIHRQVPEAELPPDNRLVTLGVIEADTYADRVSNFYEAMGQPENWPYRLDEAARRRAEEAANTILARWPQPPTAKDLIEE